MAQDKGSDRADRLKAALKENLKRRKTQGRARRDGGAAAPTDAATDKRDSSD